jgi:hypothetical protein
VLGRLTTCVTMTSSYRVTPIVGVIGEPTDLQLDHREVTDILSIPLALLKDPRFRGHHRWNFRGSSLDVPAILYREQPIWGLTLHITEELLALL